MKTEQQPTRSSSAASTALARLSPALIIFGLALAPNLAVPTASGASGDNSGSTPAPSEADRGTEADPSSPGDAGGPVASSAEKNALVLLGLEDVQGMNQAIRDLEVLGVQLRHVFPPNVLICSVPPEVESQVAAHASVAAVHRTSVELPQSTTYEDNLRLGVRAWNRLVAPPTMRAADAHQIAEPLVGDAFPHPPSESGTALHGQGTPQGNSPAPGFAQTSDFAIGRVAVGIVLPESTGSAENWSRDRQDRVIEEITAGCNWWATKGGSAARLSFYYDIHRGVPTQYEPIQRPYYDEALWIPETLGQLGYAGGNRWDCTRNYVADMRNRFACDWGFVIFVVDSLNDADGKFSDGYFAYAYLHGPFTVMTYDNNGYGIGNMDVVTAHEMGHIFGALDEYAGASSCAAQGGYLCVPNGNYSGCSSAGDGTCVMRGGLRYGLCIYSRGQVGWRDSDRDGLFDPVDTSVVLSLNIQGAGAAYRASGTATDVPFPPGCYHQPCTINTITTVEYRVDGGPWLPASPSDGAFDGPNESFEFRVEDPWGGARYIEVRAVNSVGNSITASERPVPAVVYVDWRCPCAVPDGTPRCPFCTLPDGLGAVAECGTIRIAAGNYPGPMILSKCARLESNGGRVLLGGSGRPGALPDSVVHPDDGVVGRSSAQSAMNQPVLRSDGAVALTFQVVPGRRYEVYSSADLISWTLLQAFSAEATVYELLEPDPKAFSARFFKVVAP